MLVYFFLVDGFTDAKIDRFGEEFLNILRNYSKPGQIVKPRSKPAETWSNYGGPEKVLSLDGQFDEKMDVSEMSSDPGTSKPTILEVLVKNPLPNSKLNATQINTYKCYEDGMTVKEIATKRYNFSFLGLFPTYLHLLFILQFASYTFAIFLHYIFS